LEVNYLVEESYKCQICGKIVKTKEDKIPKCCNKYMEKIPIDICTQPPHAEHSRPMDEEDACNDFRGG
jgi:hypothetical protein